jgi:phage tail-like protein
MWNLRDRRAFDAGDLVLSGRDLLGATRQFTTWQRFQRQRRNRLPEAAKRPNLVLKRGVITRKSLLADWAKATIGFKLANPIATNSVQVMLLNPEGLPVIAWKLVNAYPVRWAVAPLQSMDDSIFVETLELLYDYLEPKAL